MKRLQRDLITLCLLSTLASLGMIILLAGGGETPIFGTGDFNFDFPDYYVGQSYNVVQAVYDAGSDNWGWQSDKAGGLYEEGSPIYDISKTT